MRVWSTDTGERAPRPRSARANGRSGPRRHRRRRQPGRLAHRDCRRRRQRPDLRRRDRSAAGRHPRAPLRSRWPLRRQPGGLQPGRLEDRNDGLGCHRSHLRRGHRSSAPSAPRARAGRLRDVPGRVEPGRRPTPLDSSRWNAHLGCAHRSPAARAAALRRPRFLGRLEPRWPRRCSPSRGSAPWSGTRRAASGCARWRRARRRRTWSSAATGRRLANTTVDERAFAIRIWDWPEGVETLKLRDSGLRVALSPDGRLLAGVRPRQPVPFVRVWALDPELLLRIARSRVTRSLTDEECRRYLQRPCPEGG